ncbi:MAG: hypothetical protein EXS08_09330 [Planctomycetes bacterium]|nr:hypothetical protein [Planctomycetota bacterium]
MRCLGVSLLALLLAAGSASCGGSPPTSVLLITLDTTRADALGAYGRVPSVTPNLDRLAQEGVVFEQAYTVAPLTLPAHASMLTGLYPPRHGVRDNGIAALAQSAETLAERARAAGAQTAAFLGSVVLDQGFGLEQGFERYEAPARHFFGGPSMGYAERPASEVASLVTSWLRARDAERPFFLWAHLWDAHGPYTPTPELAAKAGGDAYLGEIAADDLAVGRIVAALRAEKLLDSTWIIVVADHGEAFEEHGEVSHGPFVWNTTLRVPLVLRLPGGERGGERVADLASVVDVYPTALAALGLEPTAGIDGRDLLADAAPGRGLYFESYYGFLNFGWHPLSGWIDASGKYVHAPQPRFYAPGDANEEHDLAGERATEIATHRGALAELAGATTLAPDAEQIDPELKRALQAVGYGAFAEGRAPVPAPLAELALPDPHGRVEELRRFQQAAGLIAGGQNEAAESLLRKLVTENPTNHLAWDRLALSLMRQNRHKEALVPLQKVLDASAGNADTWAYLGACELVAGAQAKALAAFTRALELDPNHAQALGGLVQLMRDAGLGKEAAPFQARFEAVQSRP